MWFVCLGLSSGRVAEGLFFVATVVVLRASLYLSPKGWSKAASLLHDEIVIAT